MSVTVITIHTNGKPLSKKTARALAKMFKAAHTALSKQLSEKGPKKT